ncbi:ankyrin repeat domain-containing protein [Wolbachia endosymbiont (group A) of Sicus ferrugineus]|uniref:ankyrin repeat domain-containing protein n=1 Tax=Wolbachia endosymbiont (group A) of Sicus ferrugineus TaxID=2954056 RepID=UPI002231F707|nr:ankyrin repeat domain-containing protein [Wolbachia endosymbiont (group A) of Sicus ferrugineus]
MRIGISNGNDTPLYKAAYNGHLDVVKYLESKGARRSRRSIESKDLSQPINGTSKLPLWISSIVNWVKGSTEATALLTSREHNNHTVIAIPEINTAVVNNTLMLGILATSLFNKT